MAAISDHTADRNSSARSSIADSSEILTFDVSVPDEDVNVLDSLRVGPMIDMPNAVLCQEMDLTGGYLAMKGDQRTSVCEAKIWYTRFDAPTCDVICQGVGKSPKFRVKCGPKPDGTFGWSHPEGSCTIKCEAFPDPKAKSSKKHEFTADCPEVEVPLGTKKPECLMSCTTAAMKREEIRVPCLPLTPKAGWGYSYPDTSMCGKTEWSNYTSI